LFDAAVENSDLPKHGGSPLLELPLLVDHVLARRQTPGAVEQLLREGDRIGFFLFGDQPRFERQGSVDLAAQQFGLRFGLQWIEPEQQVALVDGLVILDEDFTDNTALVVLDLLAVAFHRHRSRGNHRTVELRNSRPRTEHAEYHKDDAVADQ